MREGEIVTLIGSNGAGKSTTLRSINGLNSLAAASIRFQGKDITQTAPHKIVGWASRSRPRAAACSRA